VEDARDAKDECATELSDATTTLAKLLVVALVAGIGLGFCLSGGVFWIPGARPDEEER